MANRRQFIQSGLMLSSATLVPSLSFPLPAPEILTTELVCFVFDNRFAESIETARQMAKQGITLAEFGGDLTELWSGYLGPRWQQAPMTLAGLTTRHGLFVLETLAADYGMKPVYRGEHSIAQDGYVIHDFAGPADLIARMASLDIFSFESKWATQLDLALAECLYKQSKTTKINLITSAQRVAREEPLFSWVFAPRSVAAQRI